MQRALAVALVLVALPALAKDTWTTPYPGVERLYRTAAGPLRIHALVVDLCVPGVSVRATASSERKRTVSAFGKLVSAEAAVNGDFFSFSTYGTSGLAAGKGAKWSDTKDTSSSGFVAFGQALTLLSLPSKVEGLPGGATEAVSGRPLIVQDGKVASIACASHYCELHPRTAVGLSKDRRTLYLLVVDGRTDLSIGVTCKKLGEILAGLGADIGINLDGGGSTAMWVAKSGVVNAPSDGNERVVANHLAVHANGLGGATAKMCVEDPEDELHHLVMGLDAAESTDFDGDGRADACARAAAGFRCHPSSGSGFGAAKNIAELGDAAGFSDRANWSTIRMGDITGDGRADVCARTDDGVRCWPSTGTGFGAAIVGPTMSDASGWGKPKFYTTLRMGDIDGDGRADLCARAAAGIRCWRSLGDGFSGVIEGPAWSDAAGWDAPMRYGSIRMGDIDGDHRADLCGRGASGVECWLSDGAGFPSKIAGPGWSDANGWSAPRFWSALRLADVDGDGRADLCGRAAKGIVCHLSQGTKFGPALQSDFLSDANGWWEQSNYLTMRLGDIDGNGNLDVCARANTLVACRKWTATGYTGATLTGPPLSDESGWHPFRYFRSLRLADIDGDGRDDVCARGSAGVLCWRSNGGAFPTKVDGPGWSDASGWGVDKYYGTLRMASARVLPVIEVPPGEDVGSGEDAGSWPDAGGAKDAGTPDTVSTDAVGEDSGAWDAGWDAGAPGGPDGGFIPGEDAGSWDSGAEVVSWDSGSDDVIAWDTGPSQSPDSQAPEVGPGGGGQGSWDDFPFDPGADASSAPGGAVQIDSGAASDEGCSTNGRPASAAAFALTTLLLLLARRRRT